MSSPANPLRDLLDRIREEKIAAVGIDEYVQVDRLLTRRPELTRKAARAQLRYALASLLSTNREEWQRVWVVSEEYLGEEVATELVPIAEAEPRPESEASQRAVVLVARRLLDRVTEAPRWLLAIILCVAISGIVLLAFETTRPPLPVPPSPRATPPPPPSSPLPKADWRKVPNPQPERSLPLSSGDKPRS